jgi:hypothetical protein
MGWLRSYDSFNTMDRVVMNNMNRLLLDGRYTLLSKQNRLLKRLDEGIDMVD